MQPRPFELATVLKFVDAATDALGLAREEIDSLNVFPVADADTGTNMYLTFTAARDQMREYVQHTPNPELAGAMAAFAEGGQWGARGNSGMILSQMLTSLVLRVGQAQAGDSPVRVIADALEAASTAAYQVLSDPVEGTMLSVLTSAARSAQRQAEKPGARIRDVFVSAAAAARIALARTPEQLPVLARAGVVDAGGLGLCVLLEAAEQVLTGRAGQVSQVRGPRLAPVPTRPAQPTACEVMFHLIAAETDIATLRSQLDQLGDSVSIVGNAESWRVHVHTTQAGAAVEAGLAYGPLSEINISPLPPSAEPERGLVAVAAGPGLSHLFAQVGALVLDVRPGRRPNTNDFLKALLATRADEVVVLPNDPDSIRTAEVAARRAEVDHGLTVAVIPCRAQVQGLAAAAVYSPQLPFAADVLEMTATARHVRHGAVTIAASGALTMAGACAPGDVLGVIDGDFAVLGQDPTSVSCEVLDRLLGGGGELVTIVFGADPGSADLAEACAEYVGRKYPHVDTARHDGGQQRYLLLLAVE